VAVTEKLDGVVLVAPAQATAGDGPDEMAVFGFTVSEPPLLTVPHVPLTNTE